MIKPHGSDELNPLFVYDTQQAQCTAGGGGNAALAVAQFRRGRQRGDAGRRVLQPADRLHEPGRRPECRRENAHRGRPVLPGADRQPDHGDGRQGGHAHRAARPQCQGSPGAGDHGRRGGRAGQRRADQLHGRENLPHAGPETPRRGDLHQPGAHAAVGPDPGAELLLLPDRFPRYLPHRRGNPQRDRRARLEEGRRLPDPQPHAPRPRGTVPHGHGAAAMPTAS